MLEILTGIILRQGLESIFVIVVLSSLRTIGLLFGFLAFVWAIAQMRMLRVSIALGLALPTLVLTAPQIEQVIQTPDTLDVLFIGTKELVIGYGLGLLASLPFLALQYAGAITDAFRGEADSGITDPAGGQLGTFSLLYVVIGFAVFFGVGGLWGLVAMLYQSYTIWPLDQALPALAGDAAEQVMMLLGDMFMLAVGTTIPLLAVLGVMEFVIGVAARLSRKFGLQDLTFLSKNLVAILLLPMVAWFVLHVAGPESAATDEALRMLRLVFARGDGG